MYEILFLHLTNELNSVSFICPQNLLSPFIYMLFIINIDDIDLRFFIANSRRRQGFFVDNVTHGHLPVTFCLKRPFENVLILPQMQSSVNMCPHADRHLR